MARFDVYRFQGPGAPLVIDVQANILSDLSSRVVVPLGRGRSAAREPLPRLKPIIRVDGEDYVLRPTDIAVVPAAMLRNPVANLEQEYRNDITAALDFLFQGF